jgi:hypothetical protein
MTNEEQQGKSDWVTIAVGRLRYRVCGHVESRDQWRVQLVMPLQEEQPVYGKDDLRHRLRQELAVALEMRVLPIGAALID